jgi:hypothetical protein
MENTEKNTHGIFSPKEYRPADERIPEWWRKKFVEFTGVEPTYEHYLNSPDVWEEPPFSKSRLILVIITIGVMFGILVGFLLDRQA